MGADRATRPGSNGTGDLADLLFRAELPEWAGEPAFDSGGRWPIPTAETYHDKETGVRIVLHVFRQVGGRSVLSWERVLPPSTGRGFAHRHLDYEEQFVVRSGRATYRVGRRRGTLEAGEELAIPPGLTHIDPYNDSEEPLELLSLFSPGPMFPFVYARTLGQATYGGRVNRQGELRLPHLMVVLRETRAETFAAGPPPFLQRTLVIPALAFIGRRLGYRAAVW